MICLSIYLIKYVSVKLFKLLVQVQKLIVNLSYKVIVDIFNPCCKIVMNVLTCALVCKKFY